MYEGKDVSVVMPAYNEEESIEEAVDGFLEQDATDEVVVANNNSTDRTRELAEEAGATVVDEEKQGYGNALMRGMAEADGDLIVTVEPDGTFEAEDLKRFLVYSDQFDVVFGTRVSKEHIHEGAKMSWFLRWGNIAIAKYLEFLFGGASLTDVGCTFKLIHRDTYAEIEDDLTVGGSAFSPHFMIQCLRRGDISCAEIPVNYMARKGESKITYNFHSSLTLGFEMLWLITKARLFG